jgi:hypothetical protein
MYIFVVRMPKKYARWNAKGGLPWTTGISKVELFCKFFNIF